MLMIEPCPALSICGTAYLQPQNDDVNPMVIIRFHFSVVRCSTDPSPPVVTSWVGAALFTRSVNPPNSATVAATASARSSSTSQRTKTAVPPASWIEAATAFPRSSLRPETSTLAPSDAIRTAIAFPIPCVEPVTKRYGQRATSMPPGACRPEVS
jgi:hypothetical protein